jgi:hypothetical protein
MLYIATWGEMGMLSKNRIVNAPLNPSLLGVYSHGFPYVTKNLIVNDITVYFFQSQYFRTINLKLWLSILLCLVCRVPFRQHF